MKSHLHITILTAVAALFLHTSGTTAQNITEIAKSDPLIITGSVGTQNTYFHSTAGSAYASPLSNTLFLNLNISMYGFNMPFSPISPSISRRRTSNGTDISEGRRQDSRPTS